MEEQRFRGKRRESAPLNLLRGEERVLGVWVDPQKPGGSPEKETPIHGHML